MYVCFKYVVLLNIDTTYNNTEYMKQTVLILLNKKQRVQWYSYVGLTIIMHSDYNTNLKESKWASFYIFTYKLY